MNNVEHISGVEQGTALSPDALEQMSAAQIRSMVEERGYHAVNAADAARKNAHLPVNLFLRSADGKIIHLGTQGKKYWMNTLVEDAENPTARETLILQIHNGYRGIAQTQEGEGFRECTARHVTGLIREEQSGLLKKLRGVFSTAA